MRSLISRFLFVCFALVGCNTTLALDLVDLGPLGNSPIVIFPNIAINELGEVAGVIQSNGSPLPFTWQDGVMTPLPMLPGTKQVNVTGINDSGQVVGYSDGADGNTYAVTWINGAISKLPTSAGTTYSIATAINDSGQIVGGTGTSFFDLNAVSWQGGTSTTVNVTSGVSAYAVSNTGQIVGGGWPMVLNPVTSGFSW